MGGDLKSVLMNCEDDQFGKGKLTLVFARTRTAGEIPARIVEILQQPTSEREIAQSLRIRHMLTMVPNLKTLDLSNKDLGHTGGQVFLDGFDGNTSITTLKLSGNGL